MENNNNAKRLVLDCLSDKEWKVEVSFPFIDILYVLIIEKSSGITYESNVALNKGITNDELREMFGIMPLITKKEKSLIAKFKFFGEIELSEIISELLQTAITKLTLELEDVKSKIPIVQKPLMIRCTDQLRTTSTDWTTIAEKLTNIEYETFGNELKVTIECAVHATGSGGIRLKIDGQVWDQNTTYGLDWLVTGGNKWEKFSIVRVFKISAGKHKFTVEFRSTGGLLQTHGGDGQYSGFSILFEEFPCVSK